MPWSKPCGGTRLRSAMITFRVQLTTLAGCLLAPTKGARVYQMPLPWPANASISVPDSHTSTDSCGQRQPLLPSCHCLWARGTSPVATACLPAGRSWRNFPCSWRKQDMDATRIPPGCAPSARPIERTVPHLLIVSWPGPKSGVGCRLTTLLILLHCQVSHSVRVPALSVGAGEELNCTTLRGPHFLLLNQKGAARSQLYMHDSMPQPWAPKGGLYLYKKLNTLPRGLCRCTDLHVLALRALSVPPWSFTPSCGLKLPCKAIGLVGTAWTLGCIVQTRCRACNLRPRAVLSKLVRLALSALSSRVCPVAVQFFSQP